ncbi:MAG: ParB/RepB/Spo0J family partition protein [Proteobacteria bacterium]|nr:ParB/RepB/Spo0J family partition protein [Pseudomonadota bacterium]
MSKPALGRGLSALLGGGAAATRPASAPASAPAVPAPKPAAPVVPAAPAAVPAVAVVPSAPASVPVPPVGDVVQKVAVTRVRPCAFQPRKDFAEDAIAELADSIKVQGIISPLIVRVRGDGFELIAGERRWRAAQKAGLTEVPIIVREADDRAVLELALIENLQRENLNPIEEALGYAQLIEQFQLTQETAAVKVGKSRTVVANALRLLKLAPELQGYLRHGQLSVGHAKVILGLTGAPEQRLAAERVLKDGLNVRQTEELVTRLQQSSTQAPTKAASGGKPAAPRDVHVASLENKLQERFGTKVAVRYRKGKGAVEIRFFNDDDLDRILQIAGVKVD